ncbi:ester cyclase [Actinomycetospora sp. TBRC 11914]|uniref:ester cyclase n=1 Tax=Actinomycetospora sp. TBRC 11914 TaxID=2729387 RepID=UPI00145F640F|nr:ester cyclase [Actinomycetospora sp. TBRC 11914]NMO90217.1 ester cyclase [Actinomycetospora sp. TBRC 11914]
MPTRTSAGPPAPTPPGTDASPTEVVRWVFDIVNTHRSAPLRDVLTADVRLRLPDATYRGVDAVLGFWEGLFAAVPDLTVTMQAVAEQDGTVFVRWTLTGTHSGAEWAGIGPTGAHLDLDGIDHVTVSGGRIHADFVVFDQLQVARQLGLAPAEGSRLDVALRRGRGILARLRH